MKKWLIGFAAMFAALSVQASTFYVNGIATSIYGAEAERIGVQNTIGQPVKLLYNYSEGTANDIKQVLKQKAGESNFNATAFMAAWSTFDWKLDPAAAQASLTSQQKALSLAANGFEDPDYLKMLTAMQQYNSGPVILIGYSQGSLYANKLVTSALAAKGTYYRGALAVNIASMARGNVDKGQYMTSSKDLVAKTLNLGYSVQGSNISLPFHWNEKMGHDLLKVYLKDGGNVNLVGRYNLVKATLGG